MSRSNLQKLKVEINEVSFQASEIAIAAEGILLTRKYPHPDSVTIEKVKKMTTTLRRMATAMRRLRNGD